MGNNASWPVLLLTAYVFGGFATANLFLANHELSHNLAFRKPLYNQMLAIFANLPMAIPAAVTFKRYHLEHHRYQGESKIDTDLPMDWEGKLFNNTASLIQGVLGLRRRNCICTRFTRCLAHEHSSSP